MFDEDTARSKKEDGAGEMELKRRETQVESPSTGGWYQEKH